MCKWAVAAAAAIALVPFSAPVAAGPAMPTVRVVAEQASVHERTDPRSAVIVAASTGAEFEVIDRSGDWYWVLTPRDADGSRHSGWIHARGVEVATPATPGAAPRTLTGQIEGVPSTLPAPQTAASAKDEKADARLLKAERQLELARRQYEAVTNSAESR
jgi:hypothetical protein